MPSFCLSLVVGPLPRLNLHPSFLVSVGEPIKETLVIELLAGKFWMSDLSKCMDGVKVSRTVRLPSSSSSLEQESSTTSSSLPSSSFPVEGRYSDSSLLSSSSSSSSSLPTSSKSSWLSRLTNSNDHQLPQGQNHNHSPPALAVVENTCDVLSIHELESVFRDAAPRSCKKLVGKMGVKHEERLWNECEDGTFLFQFNRAGTSNVFSGDLFSATALKVCGETAVVSDDDGDSAWETDDEKDIPPSFLRRRGVFLSKRMDTLCDSGMVVSYDEYDEGVDAGEEDSVKIDDASSLRQELVMMSRRRAQPALIINSMYACKWGMVVANGPLITFAAWKN